MLFPPHALIEAEASWGSAQRQAGLVGSWQTSETYTPIFPTTYTERASWGSSYMHMHMHMHMYTCMCM